MEIVVNYSSLIDGKDGCAYGFGDVVFADGKSITRYVVMFSNGHVHGGNKAVIIFLASSDDPAAHAWRMRETKGTL